MAVEVWDFVHSAFVGDKAEKIKGQIFALSKQKSVMTLSMMSKV